MKKQIHKRAPGAGRKTLGVERHTITLLKEHADALRRISPSLSYAVRCVIQEAPKWLWCKHPRLELRDGQPPPGLDRDVIWIAEPYLYCPECKTHPVMLPDDLNTIVNIPHPPKNECEHPRENRAYNIGIAGGWTCVQCGERHVESPSSKLEIRCNDETPPSADAKLKVSSPAFCRQCGNPNTQTITFRGGYTFSSCGRLHEGDGSTSHFCERCGQQLRSVDIIQAGIGIRGCDCQPPVGIGEVQAAGGFWAGAEAFADAPLRVTAEGVLTAVIQTLRSDGE